MGFKPTLSVVIITLNEEKTIKDCLESVKWADEIVVVDSLSQDKTVEIAKRYTDRIYKRKFTGFGEQKNYALSKATGEWMLSIDADELVTPTLKEEIKKVLKNPQAEGYYIPRKSHFLGKWIKHCGWWPDYVLRLFRKKKGRFSKDLLHEKVLLDGVAKKLTVPLVHYPYPTLKDYLQKFNRYIDLYAKQSNVDKISVFEPLILGSFKFIKMYFLQFGFLDGKEGLILSILSAFHIFTRYLKIWEKQRSLK